jgi:hypothetical protein
LDVQQIELSIVLGGTYLETSSLIGLTMYIEGGESTPRSIANWLSLLHASQENVRCVMGYIINLTVIMDDISRTAASNVTENAAQNATGTHIRSGRRDSIHRDIRSFVTETFAIRFAIPQKDLVLEKIEDLIGHHCSPPLGNS